MNLIELIHQTRSQQMHLALEAPAAEGLYVSSRSMHDSGTIYIVCSKRLFRSDSGFATDRIIGVDTYIIRDAVLRSGILVKTRKDYFRVAASLESRHGPLELNTYPDLL